MPEKKYDPEHHHHPGPAPFPIDRCADECDDQLPLFSQVGRGLQGDGFEVVYDEATGELIGYEVDPRNGEQTEIWRTKIEGHAEELSFSYQLRPWTDPKTFTMTFVYSNPDTGEVLWSWTTPAIPYTRPEGESDIGSGVATLYIRKKGTSNWIEKLVYPDGITHDSANAPDPLKGWTVNLEYGVGADIDVPSTDDLAKVIGVNPQRIKDWIRNPEPTDTIADQDLKHYIDRKNSENVNILNGLIPVGTIWLFGGADAPEGWHLCDGTSMDKTEYSSLYETIGDVYGSDSLTFKLPNLCGRFPLGLGNSGLPYGNTTSQVLGETGGEVKHTLTGAESGVREHYHEANGPNGENRGFVYANSPSDADYSRADLITRDQVQSGAGAKNVVTSKIGLSIARYTKMSGDSHHTRDYDAFSGHENMPPYVTLNYIIKIK